MRLEEEAKCRSFVSPSRLARKAKMRFFNVSPLPRWHEKKSKWGHQNVIVTTGEGKTLYSLCPTRFPLESRHRAADIRLAWKCGESGRRGIDIWTVVTVRLHSECPSVVGTSGISAFCKHQNHLDCSGRYGRKNKALFCT